MSAQQVSVTRTVSAPPSAIFDLLTDPAKHPLIDGSGTVQSARGTGETKLVLGSSFGMDMKAGLPYRVSNKVVEFEENALIAWRHFGGHRWRWQLVDLGDGRTEVTETFDWSTARIPVFIKLMGFPERNRMGMVATLDRLDEVLATQS